MIVIGKKKYVNEWGTIKFIKERFAKKVLLIILVTDLIILQVCYIPMLWKGINIQNIQYI